MEQLRQSSGNIPNRPAKFSRVFEKTPVQMSFDEIIWTAGRVGANMKLRHAAALALAGWYLIVVPTTTNAQESPISTPSRKAAHAWPTVSHAQAGAVDPDAVVPEAREAYRRSEAAIAANQWVLKVPHVTGMNPIFILKSAAPKRVVEGGIRVWVYQPNNVREVERKVPSQLDGVPVVVEVVVWCLSVSEGKDVAKHCSKCLKGKEIAEDCSDCATTLELVAHSCEKEFKTKAQCESGAAKYVKDWYVDADKNGDMVVLAPTAHCWKNINPINSHWDPITEKAVPDNQ